MPPVRWKGSFIVAVLLVPILSPTDAQHAAQDGSSDGWRPILGTKRHPPGFVSQQQEERPSKAGDGITQYKNPIKNFEIVKADVFAETTAYPQTTFIYSQPSKPPAYKKTGGKTKYHTKPSGPYITLPTGSHGPHIPIGASSHGSRQGQPMKKPYTLVNKAQHQLKRKPVRGQALSHSTRDEVYVPPPSTNQFAFTKLAPSNVKTRETQGLGLLGANHYSINQPHSHVEFSNRFALPDESLFQRPVPTFIFAAKPPTKFQSQSDEYTRNLVPPPPRFKQEKEKIRTAQTNKDNIVAVTEPVIKISQFSAKPGRFGARPGVFENLAVQVASPFEQNFGFSKQKSNNNREQAVDVQVTRENIKQFNNVPNGFNPHIEYVDYDFHTVPKPADLPKLQTYEVTEGKVFDNRNPFQFSFHQSPFIQQQQQKFQKIQSARPGFLFQDTSTSRPIFNTAPLVELNVPQFLPTPYKPEGVLPTSPTQAEVSTIFSQLSTKMNKYRQEAISHNPIFFNIQEVSTHYPILGKPERRPDDSTDTPLPMKENGEITNEIATNKEPQKEEFSSEALPEKDPTRTRVNQRRRQRPRRPSTTSTTSTTTTEEPEMKKESVKSQETEETEEASMEGGDKTYRRKKPRPIRYRTKQSSQENGKRPSHLRESEERPNTLRESEEKRQNYRHSGSGSEQDTEVKQRGRYRFRPRGQSSERANEIRTPTKRRRIRPTSSETPANHKADDSLSGSYESNKAAIMEDTSVETSGIDSLMVEDMAPMSEGEEQIRSQIMNKKEIESLASPFPTIHEVITHTTRPLIEEVQATERFQPYDRTSYPVSPASDQLGTTIVPLPENEVDYSTVPSISSSTTNENEELNLATTLPSTTTTTEVTTTKGHRIRGRPMKFDSSNRPKFSVKDYRQRLTQYTSTEMPTSTDFQRTTTENNVRLRFPNRIRTRPTTSSPTTSTPSGDDENDTETPQLRNRFRPKEPRHQMTTENDMIITEKNVKAINTRLRPFGRQRTTTEASTTHRVSIKPNLFSAARRRSQYPSLKTRIQNRLKKNETLEEKAHATENDVDASDLLELTTQPFESLQLELSTESRENRATSIPDENHSEEITTEIDIAKNDAIIYSQRVSDLTSSSKNAYDIPGLFKSVSPTSRRIPNYFTISTDDPILPIEAFFPNLKDKDKSKS